MIIQKLLDQDTQFYEQINQYQASYLILKKGVDQLIQQKMIDHNINYQIHYDKLNSFNQFPNIIKDYYLDRLQNVIKNQYQLIENSESNNLLQILDDYHQLIQQHKTFLNNFSSELAENCEINFQGALENVIKQQLKKFFQNQFIHFIMYIQINHKKQVNDIIISDSLKQELNKVQIQDISLENIQLDIQKQIEITIQLKIFNESLHSIYQIILEQINLLIQSFTLDSPFLQNWVPLYQKVTQFQHAFGKNYLSLFEVVLNQHTELNQIQLKKIHENLNSKIQEIYILKMISFCFDIILNYPESNQIVSEIQSGLSLEMHQNLLQQLVNTLTEQMKVRLLIPGVITNHILNYYINSLMVMQQIDPKGIVYDRVIKPIQNYLLQRNDTLKQIIQILSDENYSKFIKEKFKIPSKEQNDSSDEDEQQAERWEVLQLKHKTYQPVKIKYQENDLLSLLVNLYGSQKHFIQEYQNILAEKMMGIQEFKIDEEIKNLELLKKNCGDYNLQTCNIIVNDVKDSERVNKQIHQVQKGHQENQIISFENLNCLFISKGYWPINYDVQGIKLPQQIQDVFQEYDEKFQQIKQMRKLTWHQDLGKVDVQLQFDNGSFDFKCLPVHAVLINVFDEDNLKGKKFLSAETVSKITQIPEIVVTQKMSFWVHKGVINQEEHKLQINYYTVDNFIGNQQIDMILIEEDENEMLQREQQIFGLESSQYGNKLEKLVIEILELNGPKTLQQLNKLMQGSYRNDFTPFVRDLTKTHDLLKYMKIKQKIQQQLEFYFV